MTVIVDGAVDDSVAHAVRPAQVVVREHDLQRFSVVDLRYIPARLLGHGRITPRCLTQLLASTTASSIHSASDMRARFFASNTVTTRSEYR